MPFWKRHHDFHCSQPGDVTCYMTNQVVSSLKLVRPDDFQLEPQMEILCAQREQERLAAYKWLQALDNQVRLLSQKSEQPLSLESFTPHFRHLLGPHKPGDVRRVGPNGATIQRGNDHIVVDMEGATELPVAAIMARCGCRWPRGGEAMIRSCATLFGTSCIGWQTT